MIWRPSGTFGIFVGRPLMRSEHQWRFIPSGVIEKTSLVVLMSRHEHRTFVVSFPSGGHVADAFSRIPGGMGKTFFDG
jgi:hypothetical protein